MLPFLALNMDTNLVSSWPEQIDSESIVMEVPEQSVVDISAKSSAVLVSHTPSSFNAEISSS